MKLPAASCHEFIVGRFMLHGETAFVHRFASDVNIDNDYEQV